MNTHRSTPPRAVISARVSVDDFGKGKKTKEEQTAQASISIEAQIMEARALVEREGYILVTEPLIDDGVSGFKGADRKGFDQLMRLVIGGHVDVIVTRAVDRIGRNDVDNSAIRIATKEAGVTFHLFNGSVIDPRQSSDKLTLQITQGIAEYQSAVKSETLRNVYSAMRERGELRSGHKAFGWQWEKGNPAQSMLADSQERAWVEEAYRRVLAGDTLYAICADWNSRRVPTVGKSARWSTQALRAVLLRPSNAQFIREGNGWNYREDGPRGKWDRLIDDETYLQARALLLSPARRTNPGRKGVHLASGIVRCGVCGAPLRSSSVSDKKNGRDPIYRCNSKIDMPTDPGVKHVSARAIPLDAVVRHAVISAFVFGPANLFPNEEPSRAADLYRELDGVIASQRELQELVALKLRTALQVAPDMRKLNAQEAALRVELEAAQAKEADSMLGLADLRAGLWAGKRPNFDSAASYATALGERFDALPMETRRSLVRHLLYIEVAPRAPGVLGSRRWLIAHRRATGLNGPVEREVLAAIG